jgi:hypothetical protein
MTHLMRPTEARALFVNPAALIRAARAWKRRVSANGLVDRDKADLRLFETVERYEAQLRQRVRKRS